MSYCTVEDILKVLEEKKLIQLTDDENTGSYNTERVNKAISDAEAEINGYCQERYSQSLPFDPVPDLIRSLCVDIAIYRLWLRRGRIPEEWTDRYKRAVEMLRDIADGRISLGDPSISEDQVLRTSKTEEDMVFKDPMGY